MENAGKPKYITATSLTARQINRSVILNIIYAQQPISRADTARVTGLQRSTVSLIVDELINEGWIVEGEYNRIPRGRRPIFLQLNAEHAGFIGIHLTRESLRLAAADLNGVLQWMGEEKLADFSTEKFGNALRRLAEKAGHNHNLQIKGVGVAIDDEVLNEEENIRIAVADVFKVPVAIDATTVACGKRFLIFSKDAKLANGHLVVVHADTHRIDLGIIVAGKRLRGAHGRAGSELRDEPADRNAGGGGVQTATATRTTKEVANRLEFAVAAYDPGVILLSGPLVAEDGKLLAELEKRLSAIGAGNTALRVLESESEQESLYLNGAVAVILDYFLDECPG